MARGSKEQIDALTKRVEESERVIKALLAAMKDIEEQDGEEYMPEGTYYGTEFKDEE